MQIRLGVGRPQKLSLICVAMFASIVSFQGCVAIYVSPDPNSEQDRGTNSGRLSEVVLGVSNFNDGLRGYSEVPYDLQTLVDALNEHHVFKQVANTDRLNDQPDLILTQFAHAKLPFTVHGEGWGPLCVGYYYPISLLTLTILPIYCSGVDQVSLAISRPGGKAEESFVFTRLNKTLIGIWAPIVATVNSNWIRSGLSDNSENHKKAKAQQAKLYKHFIAHRFREVEPAITKILDDER